MSEFFEPLQKKYKIFRRRGDRILLPPAGPAVQRPAPLPRLHRVPTIGDMMRTDRAVQRRRVREENFLLRLPVGVVVVDRRYDIRAINSAARRILGIYGAAIGDDLIHVARSVNHSRLREAIDSAFRSGATTGIDEFPVEDATTGEQYFVQVTCHPSASMLMTTAGRSRRSWWCCTMSPRSSRRVAA